jgi:predicted dienelactone hydrolase
MNANSNLTRRGLLAVGSTLAVGLALGSAPWRTALADTRSTRLRLPAPTGPYQIGTTSLHLVDQGRVDPLAPTPRLRELMVRLWYPTGAGRRRRAAYLSQGVAAIYTSILEATSGADLPDDLLTFPTHSQQDAPVLGAARWPVVLFSPGQGLNATIYTALLEDLASHGYIAVGIDHTFDASAVEFPGGRLELAPPESLPIDVLRPIHAADIGFVLDQLIDGHAPTNGLSGRLDRSRIAAFGHSLGSLTTINALDQDARIRAGAILDGNPLGTSSLRQPFLMMGRPTHRRTSDPDWAAFYDRLRGPRLHLVVDGTAHTDFSDISVFKEAIDVSALFETGPIDGRRSLVIQRTYLTAWFERALRHRRNPLLQAESSAFPEVDFQP